MKIKIALAGNPNSGKTTLFNYLTGSAQYVGNWPGVTVEKKEGNLKDNSDVIIQDLPGIYSLSPYTNEEVVSREYLVYEKPDAIINIVDGTNIERNLYLTTQLMEIGIPMVIAINMIDVVRKNGDKINLEKLAKDLGMPVIEISALKGIGTKEIVDMAVKLAKENKDEELPHVFDGSVEHAIAHIEESIEDKVAKRNLRWFSIKIFERDSKVISDLKIDKDLQLHLEEHIVSCEKELDDDSESIIISQRYDYVTKVVKAGVVKKQQGEKNTSSDKIDKILTNRYLALPIFMAVMFLVYYISISTVGAIMTDFTNDIIFGEWILPTVENLLVQFSVATPLIGLIVEGVIGGVGSVLGFVPQMMVLFLILSILEDCGYMSRIAFIMDRIFRKFGLSGKSFIPMLIGSGCSVPGIMASRTIEQENERRMTVITTSFIPCGAKMPIIALISGAFFGGAWWMASLAYFIGVSAVICTGIILKKTKAFAGDVSPFVMELPPYHMPIPSNIWRSTWERCSSFIKKAGTIVLLASILIWFLKSFGFVEGTFAMVEDMDHSMLAIIGGFFAPVFAPLGFGSWQAAVATIMGLVAKEEVVGVFGVLYGAGGIAGSFTALSGFSFLVFNLLCAPCFAAIGAIKREMNSAKWTIYAISYLCVFAYCVSLIIYQFGMLATAGFGIGTGVAIVILAGLMYLLFRKNKYIVKEKKNVGFN